MVYSIGVCDDDEEYQNLANIGLQKAAKRCKVEIEVIVFSSGKELLNYIESDRLPDLLFLDIDMPEMNGIEIAKRIREVDEKQLLVFLSAHAEYVFQSFEVQPFRFVRKHVMEMELFLVLQAAISVLERRKPQYILLSGKKGEEPINIMSICYVEILSRKLHFYLADGREIAMKMTMSKLIEEMKENGSFTLLDRGLLLNTTYVQSFTRKEVVLKSGLVLPIARTRWNEVRKAIMCNRRQL